MESSRLSSAEKTKIRAELDSYQRKIAKMQWIQKEHGEVQQPDVHLEDATHKVCEVPFPRIVFCFHDNDCREAMRFRELIEVSLACSYIQRFVVMFECENPAKCFSLCRTRLYVKSHIETLRSSTWKRRDASSRSKVLVWTSTRRISSSESPL